MPTTKITNRSLGVNVARDNLGMSSTMASFLSGATSTDLRLAMGTNFTTGTSFLVFNTTPTITTPFIAQINGGLAANDDLTLQGTTNATRATSYVLIQPNGGNVGIGTSTATERLTLSGNLSASGTIIASNYNPAANVATFLASPTPANLAAAVTDETGSGSLVFNTSPNFTGTPTISSRPILSELGFQRAFLSSDFTTTASTAVSSFSLNFIGGKTYKIEIVLQITGASGSTHNGTLNGTFNLSAVDSSILYRRAGFETQSFVGTASPFAGFALFNSTGTATQICFIDGIIKPSTSGTLTLTVGGTAASVTLQKGAYMEATLLD